MYVNLQEIFYMYSLPEYVVNESGQFNSIQFNSIQHSQGSYYNETPNSHSFQQLNVNPRQCIYNENYPPPPPPPPKHTLYPYPSQYLVYTYSEQVHTITFH